MDFNRAYNRNELLSFLRVDFLPNDFVQDSSILPLPCQFKYTQSVTKLGECSSLDLIVYEIYHCSKNDARVGLTKEAFRLLAEEFRERALVLFVPMDDNSNYRFSLIEITLEQPDDSARVKRTYSNPHRYSYFLGVGIATHTPNQYLKKGQVNDFKDLQGRFSVEALSDEFFEEFDKLYSNEPYPGSEPGFIEEFEANPAMLEPFLDRTQEDLEKQKKPMRDYVKKLMGRLVFMQFLQKKGWLGVPADKEGWTEGNEHFLQDIFRDSSQRDNFLDDVLEPLFFEYLNTPYEFRKHKNLFINGQSYKVPYLNGGLFEQTDLDRKPSRFSVQLFQRLFDLFDRYNFTVDENDPDDIQVSVDPEMLGRIFENQLEDNNDKGAFYTPKFIVQYMCRESLIAYLQTNVNDDFERECIRYFVEAHDKEILTAEQQEEILQRIKNVKICDPAIGSGAFPMGLLKELFQCRTALEGIDQHQAAAIKKHIIQQNIYGVDIERGAVDIARLRFWLSLIVDEETPQALPNLDYKIVEGNSLLTTFDGLYINLDTKKQRHYKVAEMNAEKRKLYLLKKEFYNAYGERKMEITKGIKDSILRLIAMQIGYESRSWLSRNAEQLQLFGEVRQLSFKEILPKLPEETQQIIDRCNSLHHQLNDTTLSLHERAQTDICFFDWRIIFTEVFDNENPGFDIVIGNPPYIRQEKLEHAYKKLLCSVYPNVGEGTADILVYFFGLGINILCDNGILSFISSNKFLKTKYGRRIRNTFANDVDVISFIDFFELPVFNNASTDAGITLLSKRQPVSDTKYFPVKTLTNLNLSSLTSGNYLKVIKNETEWQFIREEESSILDKMNTNAIPLTDFVNYRIYSGVKTGLNQCFMLKRDVMELIINGCTTQEERRKTEAVIKKAYRSRDIRKYKYVGPEQWLLFIHWHFPIPVNQADKMEPQVALYEAERRLKEEYPSLYRYLLSYHKELSDRNKDETGIRYEWYALQRWGAKYYKEFDEEKLIYIHTAKEHEFYYDTEKHYVNNSCYIIVTRSKFLYCFLNSALFRYFKKIKFVAYGDGSEEGRCKLDGNKMATVPIRLGASEQIFEQKFIKLQKAVKEQENSTLSILEEEINLLIYHLYDLTYDEVLIVDPETPITREEYENETRNDEK